MYTIICFLVSVLIFNIVFFGTLAIRYFIEARRNRK